MYDKDLVLGVKVDLKGGVLYTGIIEIHGEFCYTKWGSGGRVKVVYLDTFSHTRYPDRIWLYRPKIP
jgi:hypothetical protein